MWQCLLGPGFLEHIYRHAMIIELRSAGLSVETEKVIPIYYKDRNIGFHKLGIPVENQLIIELKVVEALGKAQYAQVRSYLKAAKLNVGLLVNFAGARVDFRRVTFPHSQPLLHFHSHAGEE